MKYVLAVSLWTLLVYKDIYAGRFFLDDYLHLHLVDRISNPFLPFISDLMMGAFFRPGVFWLWKLNLVFAGLNPSWYYAVNMGVFLGILALLMQTMQHLTGNKRVSAFATLIFAVSPISAQGVLWLSNRFDLLATFFVLSSLVLFLRFLRFNKKRDISWSLVLGAFSYFCKEIALTLPALLVLSGLFMFHYRGKLTKPVFRRVLVLSLPYFIAAAAFMMWRYVILGTMGGYVGEERVPLTLGYLLGLAGSFGQYVWLFLNPIGFGVFFLVLLGFFCKRRLLAGNLVALYGLAFAVITAAPLAMVLKVEKVMLYHTPRFFFLPGVGLAIFVAAVYDPRSGKTRRLLACGFLILAAFLSSVNTYLVTYHTKEQTQRAEGKRDQVHEFLAEHLPEGEGGAIIYACEPGLDVALDSSLKLAHPELLDRAFILNCSSQTQVIASAALFSDKGASLTFPKSFTKNPNRFQDLYYGVVTVTPREILDNLSRKKRVFALYKDREGRLGWADRDILRSQMEAMGVSF